MLQVIFLCVLSNFFFILYSINIPKKKPKRLPFGIVKAFKSEDDFKSWQKEQNFSWSKSNKSKSCNNADCNKDGLEWFKV